MPDEAIPPQEAVPPKLDLRKSGILKQEPAAPQPAAVVPAAPAQAAPAAQTPIVASAQGVATVRLAPSPAPAKPIQLTATAPAPIPVVAAGPAPLQSKKETSRIPLEVARAMTEGVLAVPAAKTVRIRPAGVEPAKLAKPAVPPVGPLPAPAEARPPVAAAAAEEKRKTSRISLEAALGPAGREMEKTAAPVPKTIRLKRPADGGAAKIPGAPPSAPPPAAETPTEVLKKTAKIEEAAAEPSPTRRKTIRVKRPSAPPVAEAAAAGAPAAAPGAGRPVAMYVTPPAAPADEPGIAWSLVATAAILVALVATYLLASQAFGPDICLTRLSYGAPDLDLAWPGKITLNR